MRAEWRVWLTGGSSGIGAALARELSEGGARVALFARRREELEAVARDLPGEALVQQGDVRDRERVEEAVREAERAFGFIDVAILNAGTGENLLVDEWDDETIARVLDTNLRGAIHGIGAVLPGMLRRGSGTIVGMSSLAAYRGLPLSAPYCASKAGLSTFLESLRIDLRPRGVRVITVSPGFVESELTDRNEHPMPFLVPVDRAARRIVRGIARGRRHVHFPRRLSWPMALLRVLPVPIYDAVAGLVARRARPKRPVAGPRAHR